MSFICTVLRYEGKSERDGGRDRGMKVEREKERETLSGRGGREGRSLISSKFRKVFENRNTFYITEIEIGTTVRT